MYGVRQMTDPEIYNAIGEDGFERLTVGFYRRVREDPILAPMYPEHDWLSAQQRLRDFLIFRFGGPSRYLQERGHPRLRVRHMAFPIDRAARDRWVSLMDESLTDANFAANVANILQPFLHKTATFMINRSDEEARQNRPLKIVP